MCWLCRYCPLLIISQCITRAYSRAVTKMFYSECYWPCVSHRSRVLDTTLSWQIPPPHPNSVMQNQQPGVDRCCKLQCLSVIITVQHITVTRIYFNIVHAKLKTRDFKAEQLVPFCLKFNNCCVLIIFFLTVYLFTWKLYHYFFLFIKVAIICQLNHCYQPLFLLNGYKIHARLFSL